ncbi:DUF3389 domain-containing protein [Shewanella inventionis]|uniref:PTS sugar transporter subunit IIA n=1 Tax=Shewanella inventionis TaxID=1738770 RepID=A0ABQ1J6Y2_9GAMM|nr:DUF3389 family protein [Shewanella inventionis]MCL1157616.1 DUF3389 domain-containing protein [Shewanella inventionis]UAL41533.1 DUF3389 domain-containing protein [Shewanella inventionis]GGB59402.1 PTS sugar transporter subunit IIA [Shewanella inventionis]
MVIDLSIGKLIVTETEIQCRFHASQIVLTASVDDISCFHQGLVIAADGGTVRWSIKLDNATQLEQVLNCTGIQAQ